MGLLEAYERGGASGTGRFPTFSRRKGRADFSQDRNSLPRIPVAEKRGETRFPPRTRADGERCSALPLFLRRRRLEHGSSRPACRTRAPRLADADVRRRLGEILGNVWAAPASEAVD